VWALAEDQLKYALRKRGGFCGGNDCFLRRVGCECEVGLGACGAHTRLTNAHQDPSLGRWLGGSLPLLSGVDFGVGLRRSGPFVLWTSTRGAFVTSVASPLLASRYLGYTTFAFGTLTFTSCFSGLELGQGIGG